MRRCSAWLSGLAAAAVLAGTPFVGYAAPAARLRLQPRATAMVGPSPESPAGNGNEAESLFAEGEAAYERGEFEAAAEHFASAHAIAPHPATLYNLGMAQHRAGRLLQAYATFAELEHVANTPDERADAIAARQRVRQELSEVVVHVAPDATVCLDDAAMPDTGAPTRTRLLLPGTYALRAYGRGTELDVQPGETQTLWLDPWSAPLPPPKARPGKLATALLAVGATGAAGAIGAAAGAATASDRGRARAAAIGAVAAGGLALGTTIAAIVVLARRSQARRDRPAQPSRTPSDCREPKP